MTFVRMCAFLQQCSVYSDCCFKMLKWLLAKMYFIFSRSTSREFEDGKIYNNIIIFFRNVGTGCILKLTVFWAPLDKPV